MGSESSETIFIFESFEISILIYLHSHKLKIEINERTGIISLKI